MPLVLRPTSELVPLTEKLSDLGRLRRLAILTASVGMLIAVVAFSLAFLGTWDVLVHLNSGVRAVGLLALLGFVTGLVWGRIRPSLNSPVGAESVAHLLETKHPDFNDVLASAANFLNRDEDTRTAAKFRRAAIKRAERLADRYDLGDIVPTKPVWLWLVAACSSVLLLGGLVVSDVNRASIAASRIFHPFGSAAYPAQTYLEILEPAKRQTLLAKGDPFTIHIKVQGVIPQNATLFLKLVGSPASEEAIPLTTTEDSPNETKATIHLLPDRVTRDFEYRITANDADTDWYEVTVAAPPRLAILNGRPSPQLRLTYQPYTNQKPTDLPDGTGGIETVCGTRISLRAATDRRIVRAWLHYENEIGSATTANAVAPLASRNPFFALAAGHLGEQFLREIPVNVLGADGTHLHADFFPLLSGLYSLRFTDELGLTGSQKLDIRTYPDPAPVVMLIRPTPSGEALMMVPKSVLNLRTRADDQTYALKRLAFEYKVNDGFFQEVLLADVEFAAQMLPGLPGVRLQPQSLEAQRAIPLAKFKKADGTSPVDGDTIILRSLATDWDDYTLMKQPGRSPDVEIRVMSEEAVTGHIQKALADLRPELTRAKETQKAAADKTEAAQKATTPEGKMPQEGQDKLTQAEQNQRQLRAQISDPKDGLQAKAAKLREIAKANELANSPAKQRADAVARMLEEIADNKLSEIEPQLAEAKNAAEEQKKLPPNALAKVAKAQQNVVEKLTAAIEELEQWAAAAEVRGDARQLKQQLSKTNTDSKKLGERLPTGTTPDQLPMEDKAALEKLSENLEKAAEQASKLMSKADRVAEEKRAQAARATAAAEAKSKEAELAPNEAKANAAKAEAAAMKEAAAKANAEADTLEKAAKNAGGDDIKDDLRKAAEAQRQNRSSEANSATRSAMNRLDKMMNELQEKKDDALDELQKKRKAAEERVDQIADQQDELAKKITKANETKDENAKAEQLQKLAEQQEELRRETEQLSRKLEREGAEDAAEQLRRAAKEMEQARDQLAEGQDPKTKPDDALDRLEDAKKELQQDQPKDEEKLDREQREQWVEQFKNFLDKQQAAVVESERLTKAAVAAKKWERPLQVSLSSLGEREKALSKELRQFAASKTEKLKVFDRMLKQAADLMEKAAQRIEDRKADILLADPKDFDVESETAADETARKPMRAALKRLEQIVASLKEDEKKQAKKPPMPMPMGEMPPGGGGGGGGGGGMGERGVPPIAQLKALRDWQKEINERTEQFAKDHPDRTKLTDDDKDELHEIEQSQKDISQLIEELLPLLQPQSGGDAP